MNLICLRRAGATVQGLGLAVGELKIYLLMCPERDGFPDGWGFGKCVPEFAFGMGCCFRLRGSVETTSQYSAEKWDAVSG